jgi:PKD repeat protein
MKGKMKISAILTVVLLTLATFAVFPAFSVPVPTMYIDPAYKNGGLEPGDNFDLTLMIKDFTDMSLWQAGITFNPAVLEVITFDIGPTLVGDVFDVLTANPTLAIPGAINNPLGKVGFSSQGLQGLVMGVTGVPDQGYKCIVFHFHVKGYTDGNPATLDCMVAITNSFVLDHTGAKTFPGIVPGQVETETPPAPYGPEAKFTWLPVIPQNGTDVTFDATSSKDGFDGAAMCPITEWRWNFGDGIDWFNGSDKEVWVHQFADPGMYTVYLEVYALGASPETDSVTHDVTVIPPPMGANIDLTAPTQAPYDGEGPNVACDAFAPQQLVILQAKVTYNLEPVEGKLVGFEVTDANGDCVTYRTGVTDSTGVATVEFRIPSMPAFGDWLATAIVDVAGTTVADTMPFKVGWIITLLSVEPELGVYYKGDDMFFTVEVVNIAMSSREATLTAVVYDACGVPIGQMVVPGWSIEGGATVEFYDFGIPVPSWAFVSPPTAKVYANAFTELPSNDGVPYCPEVSGEFLI